MVEVELPDGTILEFPADMPREAIEAASRKQWARMNMSTGEDVARSAGSGALRGTVGLADLPSLARAAGNSGLGWAADKIGAEGVADWFRERGLQNPENYGRADRITRDLGGGAALDYDPTTTAGEFTQTTAEFVAPGLIGGGIGGALSKGSTAARGAAATILPSITGGIGSEAAGQATEGTRFEPAARIAGGIIGGMAAPAIERTVRGIRAPMGEVTDDVLRQQLDDLRAQGVEPTAGQATGSAMIQAAERNSMTGNTLLGQQQVQFNRAVSRLLGREVDRITPEFMKERFTLLGRVFNDFGKGVDVTPDQTVLRKFFDATARYGKQMPSNQVPDIFDEIGTRLVSSFRNGQALDAQDLARWRMTLGDMVSSSDGPAMQLAHAAREAIDDALEAGLRSAGRLDDLRGIQIARQQYRNLLAVERVTRSSGAEIARGNISMPKLRNAIAKIYDRAYVTGDAGDVGKLVTAAESLTKDLPGVLSGGERYLSRTPEMLLGAMGLSTGNPLVAGAAIAAPAAARNSVSLPFMQQWLKNTLPGSATRSFSQDAMATVPGLLGQVGGR